MTKVSAWSFLFVCLLQLVESIVGGESSMRPSVEPVLGVELLISLAEESLLRSSALPWQVRVSHLLPFTFKKILHCFL